MDFAGLRVRSSCLKALFCGRKWAIFSTSCSRTTPRDPTLSTHTGCWSSRLDIPRWQTLVGPCLWLHSCMGSQLILSQSQTGFLKQPQMPWFCYSRVLELDSNWSFRSSTVLVTPFVWAWQLWDMCRTFFCVQPYPPLTECVLSVGRGR